LILLLVLILSFAAVAPPSMASTITVDGNPSDWTMAAPTNLNTGHVGRASGSPAPGEYVWTDNGGDERTIFAGPDAGVDLTEFRVTADGTNLYFMARMTDITVVSGSGAPQVRVAIDTGAGTGGGSFLESGTQVDGNARWEYRIITRFGSGNADVIVEPNGGGQVFVGAEAINASNECIEFSVPWTALGMSGPPEVLRLTVGTFRATAVDDVWDVSTSPSNTLDCITNYGNPGDTSDTWAEVSDVILNYYFDLYFTPQGEVYSPLLISEVYYDTIGADSNEEWIQIYNASPSTVGLNDWKLGDEETVDGGEGMYLFFTGNIDSGSVVVAAQTGSGFTGLGYACSADYEFQGGSDPAYDMEAYTPWTGGSAGVFALSNSGDQVLLLDPSDTVMDVVTWSGVAYPGVTAHFGVPTGSTLQRAPVNRDTNDCSADFVEAGSNGSPCNIPTAVTLASFSATAEAGGILLNWETAIELDNLGFNLYRADAVDGPRSRLNANLILSQSPGSITGAAYSWLDESASATPGVYHYWLEAVDVGGETTLYGPVSAELMPLRRLLPTRPRLAPMAPSLRGR